MLHTHQSVKERLNKVFREVFEDEEMEIWDEMTAADVDEWDSLMHITLVIAVEKAFRVHLNAADVGALTNVGAMVDLLMTRAAI